MTMIALWKHVDHIVCVLHKQYEQKRRRTFPIWAVLIPASCDCLIQIMGHSHQAQTRPQRGLDTTATNLSETGSKQIKQGERDCNKLNKRPSVTLVSCMCLESVAISICVIESKTMTALDTWWTVSHMKSTHKHIKTRNGFNEVLHRILPYSVLTFDSAHSPHTTTIQWPCHNILIFKVCICQAYVN